MPLQEHEIPVVTIISDKRDRTSGISTSVVYDNTTSSGTDVFMDMSLYEVDYSDTIDSIIEIITRSYDGTSYDDAYNEILYNSLNSLDKVTVVTMWLALKNLDLTDIEVDIYFTGYLQNILNDTAMSYRVNLGTIPGSFDSDMLLVAWGQNYFNNIADVFCAASGTMHFLDTDVALASGRLDKLPIDIFCSKQENPWLISDVFCSGLGFVSLAAELTTISGRLDRLQADVFSTSLGLAGAYPTDFKTRSLFTGDFFIEQDNFTTATDIAWIDVVDYLYPINTDETYLSVNGTVVSGTWFEDIPNGKRLYYDPLDDFYSDGVLTYSIHTENTMGEVEDKDFYLLYGYDLHPNEVIDWGPNKTVVVRVEAQNLVFCPNREGEAFDFTTVDLKSMNLKCTIRPVGYVDLLVQISPQSTVFYYGKTYTIKLKGVKDFAGNVMPDFEYTFTIEDPLA